VNPLDFVVGLGTGLVAAAVVFLLFRHWAKQAAEDREPMPKVAGPSPTARGTEEPLDPPPGEPGTPREADELPAPGPAGAVEALPDLVNAVPEPAGPVIGSGVPPERIRLSHRVILHVYAQGSVPPGSVAPIALCQRGIGEGLGVPQAGLAAVLRRLEAAGVLVGERAHVQGRDRRLKVYRLSPRGLELAKEIRSRGSREGPGEALPAPRSSGSPFVRAQSERGIKYG
jgi:DNA-binding MarR family transcriptional regulator